MDEIVANQYDRIIQICHFKEDPISLHGIPFKFIIKNVIYLPLLNLIK